MNPNTSVTSNGPAVVRAATKDDIDSFVIPTWMSSYAHSLPAKLCRADSRYGEGREVYWSGQRLRIERLLASPGTEVLIAEIEGLRIGWCCQNASERRLDYVFVEKGLREQGVARQLVGWIDDPTLGLVRLTHVPPPWYSQRPRPEPPGWRSLWRGHVVIDLFSEI